MKRGHSILKTLTNFIHENILDKYIYIYIYVYIFSFFMHRYQWVMPPKEQKAGDYVVFRAEMDCVAAFSACPWDLGEMNGPDGKPQDCHFKVFRD